MARWLASVPVGTNIAASEWNGRLNILPGPSADGVFAMQVNPTLLRASPAALARIFVDAMAG